MPAHTALLFCGLLAFFCLSAHALGGTAYLCLNSCPNCSNGVLAYAIRYDGCYLTPGGRYGNESFGAVKLEPVVVQHKAFHYSLLLFNNTRDCDQGHNAVAVTPP